MTEKPPPDDPSLGVTKWLAGGLTFFTGALGAFGATTGGLDRAARNFPYLTWSCLAVVVVAVAVGVIGPAVSRIQDKLLILGALCVLVPSLFLAGAVIKGKSTKDRPRVAASLSSSKDELLLKGSVEASGLQTGEHILIRVEGRTTARKLALLHVGRPRRAPDPSAPSSVEQQGLRDYYQLLYAARVGADIDGNLKAPIETAARPGLYERVVVSAEVVERAGPRAAVKRPEVRSCDATTPFWGCAQLLTP